MSAPSQSRIGGRALGSSAQPLEEAIAALTAGHSLIVASNRGPVEFYRPAHGRLSTRRGAGGVVTALGDFAGDVPLRWIASAMTPGDREAFPDAQSPARTVRLGRHSLQVRYVPFPPEIYRRYYDEISNETLWFLQHYMWSPIHWPNFGEHQVRSWDEGYRPVNEAIARAIVAEARASSTALAGEDSIILLQDYHLYLAAAQVRASLPRATIEQFIHIPWPANRYWQFLPDRFVHEIYEGLAGNDVVGFQTDSDLQNFLVGAQSFLPDSRVDFERHTIVWRRRRVAARVYPVPTDAYQIRRTLLTAPARAGAAEMAGLLDGERQIIMRVDRLDPSKNIYRGFQAYEAMLRRWPELAGRVVFVAFLIPSRQSLRIYRDYEREVRRLIRRINADLGTLSWKPVVAFYDNNRPRALAAMRRYDVLLVNPISDGMNLVAKEGPAANEQDGVLVLSRTAGAFAQLGDAALPVTPTDIEETATELYEALAMSGRDRAERAGRARSVIEAESPVEWLLAQLEDALGAGGGKRRRTLSQMRRAHEVPVA